MMYEEWDIHIYEKKKKNHDLSLTTSININSKWITELNINCKPENFFKLGVKSLGPIVTQRYQEHNQKREKKRKLHMLQN